MFLLIAEGTILFELLRDPLYKDTIIHFIGEQLDHHPWHGKQDERKAGGALGDEGGRGPEGVLGLAEDDEVALGVILMRV